MEKNFFISNGVGLDLERVHLDVFNQYSVIDFHCSIHQRSAALLFKSTTQLPHMETPKSFCIHFHGLRFFESTIRMAGDCDVVDEIGFKAREDRNLDWLIQEGQQTNQDDIVFRILGGNFVRVYAQLAFIRLSSS
jgi:hypothetical protein